MSKAIKPAIDRVLARITKVPIAGCWIFMGALNDAGYGIVGKGGRGAGNDRAHRITYAHFVGPIPVGMFVCHHCDQPACCNPEHLFLGTNDDNMRDCRAKGRASTPPRNPHVVGTKHPGHKLNDADVRSIRRLRQTGWTLAEIGERFGVCDATIIRICNRESWRHVA